MSIRWNKKSTQNLVFFTLVGLMCFAFGYFSIFDHKPYSMHQWRQTDALSMTLNYYMEGMNFWEPKIHVQESIEGKAVGEFPIVYYLNAVIWKIVGVNYFSPRLITFIFSMSGLFCLFRLGVNIFKDFWWALIPPLILFISPIFIFYSNNFLVNIPALSCVFIGWHFVVTYQLKRKKTDLIWVALAFILAGLLRVTMLSGLIPLVIIFFLERFGILRDKRIEIKLSTLTTLFIPFIITGAWVIWMKNYNAVNDAWYFFTSTNPIWSSWGNRDTTWDYILFHRLPEMYQGYILFLIFVATFSVLLSYKKINKYFLAIFFTIGFITISYFLLWFHQFNHHDYYYIDYFLYTVTTSIVFLHLVKKNLGSLVNLKYAGVIFIFFFIYSTLYATVKHRLRYNYSNTFLVRSFIDSKELDRVLIFEKEYKNDYLLIEKLNPVLRKLGIKRSDLVISYPDVSSNISLFFMDQKGFTKIYSKEKSGFTTSQKTVRYIEKGAKYLVCYQPGFIEKENLSKFLDVEIYKSPDGNVTIHTLKKQD